MNKNHTHIWKIWNPWNITLWLFLKSNAGKNKQFLILIPRHPRRCGDVRKLEKNLFGWGLFEKTEIHPLNEAKSWILQSLRHFLNKVVNWIFQSAWKEVVWSQKFRKSMKYQKSAKLAPFKNSHYGTFLPLHGFSKFLWLNNLFLGRLKKSFYSFVQKVS